jgi:hypothetical protein
MHSSDPRAKASLLACLLVASCATVTPSGAPPWALLEDCHEPQAQLRTNGDLLPHIRALRGALRSCNDDKKALRDWAEKQ